MSRKRRVTPPAPPARRPPASTASSISASLTVSGGANRSAVALTALLTRPAASSAVYASGASMPSVELGAEQQPGAAHRRRPAGSPRASAVKRAPWLRGQRRRVEPAHLGDHGADRRGGDGRAAVGAAVVAGLEHGGDLAAGPAGADRHAVAQRLGQRDHVGHARRACSNPNQRPVRPKPVWISSTIISAPTLVAQLRGCPAGSRRAPG